MLDQFSMQWAQVGFIPLHSDMNELKHLCDKLQKDNKLLQIQTMDIEESSCLLRAENSKLEQKMIKYYLLTIILRFYWMYWTLDLSQK